MKSQLELIRHQTNRGGEPLGDLLWWELVNATITRPTLQNLWVQSALPSELLPEPPSPEKSFKNAARETQVGHPDRLLRLAKEDDQEIVFGLVNEKRDGSGGLTYDQEARITLHRGNQYVTSDAPTNPMVRRFFERFEDLRNVHTTDDIRRTITKTLDSFAAVTLRANGGVYWVPSNHADGLRRLQGVVEKLGQSKMHLVPITRSKEGQAALAQAAANSLEFELNALQTEVQEFLASPPERASTLIRRLNTYQDLRSRANLYQTVLSAQVNGLSESLAQMEQQVHGLLENKRAKAA